MIVVRNSEAAAAALPPATDHVSQSPLYATFRELHVSIALALILDVKSSSVDVERIAEFVYGDYHPAKKVAKYVHSVRKLEAEGLQKFRQLYVQWWRTAYYSADSDVIDSLISDMFRYLKQNEPKTEPHSVRTLSHSLSVPNVRPTRPAYTLVQQSSVVPNFYADPSLGASFYAWVPDFSPGENEVAKAKSTSMFGLPRSSIRSFRSEKDNGGKSGKMAVSVTEGVEEEVGGSSSPTKSGAKKGLDKVARMFLRRWSVQ